MKWMEGPPNYRSKSSPLRGKDWIARPYVPGEDLSHVVAFWASWGPPKEGDMLAECPKGFLDTYLIPKDVFARDFEPIVVGSAAEESP